MKETCTVQETYTVATWMGLTNEEFNNTVKWGTCIKCGKESHHTRGSLCRGHLIAFHRALNKREEQQWILNNL